MQIELRKVTPDYIEKESWETSDIWEKTISIHKGEHLHIVAPSGSGKTFSALLLAYGMTGDWNKIALIDTESGRGELYTGVDQIGQYNYLPLNPPFTPERYIAAIKECEDAGMAVIIIDSATHEWDGEGGLLEVHSKMAGNSFTNWYKITPRHNAFLQKIIPAEI